MVPDNLLLCSQKGIYISSLLVNHVRNIFTVKVSLQKCSPLEGTRVLDLTRIVAGPYCTMLLSDLGADVIKIEQPKVGDEARRWGPFLNGTDVSSYFLSLNRNKKSVCVNLKTDSGKTVIKELVKKCDVLVENYIPGKLDSLGLGYNELAVIAPHLIYCSITGYGNNGPYKLRSGVDIIAASYGGLLNLTGYEDGDPCKPGVPVTDLATGLYAYGAIMTALFQRQKTGVGQKIDCNLLSTQLSCLINIASSFLNANKEVRRLGTAHPSIVPYQTFSTADGFITICALNNDHFTNMCEVLSLEQYVRDDRFATNSLRVKNRDILVKLLKERLVMKSTKEWLTIFEGSSFPYGPVNSLVEEGTVRVKLKKQKTDKQVKWGQGTVDNEHMNKKKSKCCCVYKKPKEFGESSSSGSDDECANCPGHKKPLPCGEDGASCPLPASRSHAKE